MNIKRVKSHFSKPAIQLSIVVIIAIGLRIYYFNGIVFSDDTYYNFLGASLLNGNYAGNYLGYPIFILRKLHSLLTATAFSLLGMNQIASIFFPFLFSIAGILLAYFFALEISSNTRIAVFSSILLAFFPTDIIFASINFADLQAALFINLGLFLLLKSINSQSVYTAFFAGFLLFLSLLLKENVYFVIILLGLLLLYYFKINNLNYKFIAFALIGFFTLLFIESIYYSIVQHDFIYRLHILNYNYQFCAYDFFPNTIVNNPNNPVEFFSGLLKQIFILNTKYLFLRRYYLFLPAVALIYSIYLISVRKQKLLVFWFLGLAILMIGFTTSFTEYKPLDLRRNYYVFSLLLPIIILSASFLNRLPKKIIFTLLSIYIISSYIMSSEYQSFFDVKNNQRLIEYFENEKFNSIVTDHHTAYGLYSIFGFEDSKIKIITNRNKLELPKNYILLINNDEIAELKKQKYFFPDMIYNYKIKSKPNDRFGKFILYKNLNEKQF